MVEHPHRDNIHMRFRGLIKSDNPNILQTELAFFTITLQEYILRIFIFRKAYGDVCKDTGTDRKKEKEKLFCFTLCISFKEFPFICLSWFEYWRRVTLTKKKYSKL